MANKSRYAEIAGQPLAPSSTASADAPGDADLSVRGSRKDFTLHTIDGRIVVAPHGVGLDVRPGEHVALARTSGVGKSTLPRCVYCTYLSGSGHICFRTACGELLDVAALSDAEAADLRGQKIEYVSQFPCPARAAPSSPSSPQPASQAAIAEHLWDMHTTVLSGGQGRSQKEGRAR
ncbi:ATP-binding cassette domain-containing protein [Streptomyces scopuliridis]|uniref:ATP-binding cassette domain-containing protein n=1 Tax=Streptomyces scopuliridis TaxID=452529 RepID=UPI0036BC77DF